MTKQVTRSRASFSQDTFNRQIKNQLDEALLIRGGVVSGFNIRKRQIRLGDINPIDDLHLNILIIKASFSLW